MMNKRQKVTTAVDMAIYIASWCVVVLGFICFVVSIA